MILVRYDGQAIYAVNEMDLKHYFCLVVHNTMASMAKTKKRRRDEMGEMRVLRLHGPKI